MLLYEPALNGQLAAARQSATVEACFHAVHVLQQIAIATIGSLSHPIDAHWVFLWTVPSLADITRNQLSLATVLPIALLFPLAVLGSPAMIESSKKAFNAHTIGMMLVCQSIVFRFFGPWALSAASGAAAFCDRSSPLQPGQASMTVCFSGWHIFRAVCLGLVVLPALGLVHMVSCAHQSALSVSRRAGNLFHLWHLSEMYIHGLMSVFAGITVAAGCPEYASGLSMLCHGVLCVGAAALPTNLNFKLQVWDLARVCTLACVSLASVLVNT